MLIQFSCKNYKSFYEQASLLLTEAKITEFPESLIHSGDLKLLPLTILYGANGSGKSNLLHAFTDLCSCINNPRDILNQDLFFRFSPEASTQPTEFEILFRINDQEYDYQLKVKDHLVLEENLFCRHLSDSEYDVVFDRDHEGVYLGSLIEQVDVAALNDDTPMLSFLKDKKLPALSPLFQWFQKCYYADCQNLDQDILKKICSQPKIKKKLTSLLPCFLPSIRDIRIEAGEIFCIHGSGHQKTQLSLAEESQGTRQILNLLALWIKVLSEGGLLLAEHPYIHLHPDIFRRFLILFTDPRYNTEKAQLICTSHDMPTMTNQLLRRDEIWITARNEHQESSLYQLALFLKENGEKVRKDETYYKQFLEGRYGSTTNLQDL